MNPDTSRAVDPDADRAADPDAHRAADPDADRAVDPDADRTADPEGDVQRGALAAAGPTPLPTPADLRAFGAQLAARLRPGDLIVLTGPLGAGKTVLVQGIAAGLGVRARVTSPTFVIARVHRDGRVPLVHVDAYRLASLAEVDDLDLDVDVADSVTVVEWGAGLVERLAESYLEIRISRADETEVRSVELVGHGASWTSRVG